jgi:uncharacterized membrane protein YfcA
VPEPWQILLTTIIGFLTGVLSSSFGVGGAILSTPAIRAVGATPLEAVASTLPSIIPSSIAGVLRYRRAGLIRWPLVAVVGTAGSLTAVGGSFLSHLVPGGGHLLMVATAGLVGLTAAAAVRIPAPVLDAGPPGPTSERPPPELVRPATIGVAAGGLSGLLGVGGGIVMLPAFIAWLRLPIKEAIATSLACVGILATPATITHAILGEIDWWFALPLALAVIPGARLGARLSIRAAERPLRITMAVVLGVIAIVYGSLEVAALR